MEPLNIAVVGLGRMVSYTLISFKASNPRISDILLRVNAMFIPCYTASPGLVL